MVYRQRQGGCPRCAARLVAERSGTYSFQRCSACRGVWMETATFASMLEEMGAELVEMPSITPDEEPLTCTFCYKPMAKGGLYGIVLDHCELHGIWFDNAELQKTLAGAAGLEVDPKTPLSASVSLLQEVLGGGGQSTT